MQNKQISGEYYFDVRFQNMFIDTHIQTRKYKNIITEDGVKFFLNRLYDNDYNFKSIAHGTGTTKASKTDTTLENKTSENNNITYTVEDNTLHLKTENNGYDINNTTEIGVYYISQTETHLVSRNTHNPIIVPETSYIIVNYDYVISTAEYLPSWTLATDKTNTYYTEIDYEPNFVVETDTKNGYAKLSEITDIDSTPNSHYYDSAENILYIHCSDSESPTLHKLLINY